MRLKTADGCEVYVPLDHLAQHKSVIPYLEQVIGAVNTDRRTIIRETVDMGIVVGKCDLVPTNENDVIIYATRTGRGWPTRFAANRESTDCSLITFILKRQGANKYRMLTAYIGGGGHKEPGDKSIRTQSELAEAEAFWSSHALVWGSQDVENVDNTRRV